MICLDLIPKLIPYIHLSTMMNLRLVCKKFYSKFPLFYSKKHIFENFIQKYIKYDSSLPLFLCNETQDIRFTLKPNGSITCTHSSLITVPPVNTLVDCLSVMMNKLHHPFLLIVYHEYLTLFYQKLSPHHLFDLLDISHKDYFICLFQKD
jgi:hypothetical protein